MNVTYDGSSVSGYWAVGSGADAPISTSDPLGIGILPPTAFNEFYGNIDDVLIFKRYLSFPEVLALYNSSKNQLASNITGLNSSMHTIKGYATDAAGNKNNTEQRSIETNQIYFTSPTPADGSTRTGSSIFVNLSGPGAYTFVDFDRNLRLWMRMDDGDCPVGSAANPCNVSDLSSYSNNGSSQGDASRQANGLYQNDFSFDGAQDFINISDSASLRPQNITIAALVSPNNFDNSMTIISKPINGPSWSYPYASWLLRINDDQTIEAAIGGNGVYSSTSFNVPQMTATNWQHIVMTYNGTDIVLYVGGTWAGSASYTNGIEYTNGYPVIIGGDYGSDPVGDSFNGYIDNVLIFSRALSAEEVNSLFWSSQYSHNFTSLSNRTTGNATHIFTGYAEDQAGKVYRTRQRTVKLGAGIRANCTLGCIYIKNSTGANRTLIDKFGDMDLGGSVTENSVGSPDGRDFIFKSGGSVIAWIDDITGNLRLAGSLASETGGICTPVGNSFIIKNTTGSCKAYFNSTGSAVFTGSVNENVL